MLSDREKNLVKQGYKAGFRSGFQKRARFHPSDIAIFAYEEVFELFEKWLIKAEKDLYTEATKD